MENNEDNKFKNRVGLVYCRVSSKRQETEGRGLMSQESRCIKELQIRQIPYRKTFADSFTGGGDFMRRPAMRDLLEYIDRHPNEKFVIVFDDLKRFARDVEFHIKLRTSLRIRDVLPLCLNFNFDDSPEGRYTELLMAGSAELERAQNRRQVLQKQKARLEKGYWAFRSKRGYTMTPDALHGTIPIPNKEGLEILQPALEGFASGLYARKIDVCRFLVEKGFWKKQSPERYIDKITTILTDPFYAGLIEYKEWDVVRVVGKHKGLISTEIFDRIQLRLKKENLGKTIRRDQSEDFIHRGLVNCDTCGSHLTAMWAKKRTYRYYFCQNKKCEFRAKAIPLEHIEKGFDHILSHLNLSQDLEQEIKSTFDKVWKEETSDLIKQDLQRLKDIETVEQQIAEFAKLSVKAKNEFVRNSYETQIEKLSEDLIRLKGVVSINQTDLDTPYQTALEKVIEFLKSPYDIWVNATLKEKHELYFFIFERKLAFNHKTGYQTNKIQSYISLFELFMCPEALDVEMPGIEPGCKRYIQSSLRRYRALKFNPVTEKVRKTSQDDLFSSDCK